MMTGTVSIFTMMVISIDRYLKVRSLHGPKLTKTHTMILIGGIWILSGGIWTPVLLVQVVKKIILLGQTFTFCYTDIPDGLAQTAFVLFLILGLFVTPLVVIAICYIRIWKIAKASADKMQSTNSQKKNWRLTKMLLLIVVTFFCVWFPFYITGAFIVATKVKSTVYVAVVTAILAGTNVNPVLYGYFNENYRKAFLNLIMCRCQQRNRVGVTNQTCGSMN